LIESRGKRPAVAHAEASDQGRRPSGAFVATLAQWAALGIEPVTRQVFRSAHVTEGKIAIDEERSTLIFSPYSGRVTKLLAKPGDTVGRGQPLFVLEAADMVQAQNDFISAVTAMNKARSQLALAEIVEKRHRDLYKDKAVALRELEQSQAALVAAQNDMRAAETALEAVRNRLRILGKTDQEIASFEQTGKINAETTIYAPIAGTIVQRKIGPGQYINSGASDPVFIIGDLSTVLGSLPMCARPKRRRCRLASRSISRCSRIPTRFSREISGTSQQHWIPTRGACWSEQRFQIRTGR
jgi:cobalt-zinc-cadmium efflux system membrane fusion protein